VEAHPAQPFAAETLPTAEGDPDHLGHQGTEAHLAFLATSDAAVATRRNAASPGRQGTPRYTVPAADHRPGRATRLGVGQRRRTAEADDCGGRNASGAGQEGRPLHPNRALLHAAGYTTRTTALGPKARNRHAAEA